MRYLILAFMLSGCSNYWVRDMPGYEAKIILTQYVDQATLQAVCAKSELLTGCAIRLRDGINGPTCVIYLGPLADACTVTHEQKHCRGWSHDAWALARADCGAAD